MTHLGQRLSALIDGELDGNERERVLVHMSRCDSCRDEVAALRMLKRRMSALGEVAADAAGGAAAGLTGRLIGLSALVSLRESEGAGSAPAQTAPGADHGILPERHEASPEQRAGRYFIAGSLVVFLAGLGTAAVVAGGESPPQAPTLPKTPSVDVMVFSNGHAGSARVERPARGPSNFQQRRRPLSAHPVPSGA